MKFLFLLYSLSALGTCLQPVPYEDLRACRYKNLKIKEINFVSNNLEGVGFQSLEVEKITFADSNWGYTHFENAKINQLKVDHSIGVDANFTRAIIGELISKNSDLGGASFQFAKMKQVALHEGYLNKVSMYQAEIENLEISGVKAVELDLGMTQVKNLVIKKSILTKPIFVSMKTAELEISNSSLISSFWGNHQIAKEKYQKNFLENGSSLPQALLISNDGSADFAVGTSLKLLSASKISPSCLKKYPVGDKSHRLLNGEAVLTDGDLSGVFFRACASSLDFKVKFLKQDHDKRQSLELLVESYSQDVEEIKIEVNGMAREVELKKLKDKIVIQGDFKLDDEVVLNVKISPKAAEDFGIKEIKVGYYQ